MSFAEDILIESCEKKGIDHRSIPPKFWKEMILVIEQSYGYSELYDKFKKVVTKRFRHNIKHLTILAELSIKNQRRIDMNDV